MTRPLRTILVFILLNELRGLVMTLPAWLGLFGCHH